MTCKYDTSAIDFCTTGCEVELSWPDYSEEWTYCPYCGEQIEWEGAEEKQKKEREAYAAYIEGEIDWKRGQ